MKVKWVVICSLLIFVGILIWDAWLYADGIPGNAISQIVVSGSHKYPLLPYVIGFLSGFLASHFFDTTTQADSERINEHL